MFPGRSEEPTLARTAWLGALGLTIALCLLYAATAQASQLVARDAADVRLEVNRKGMALVTYRNAKGLSHLLTWGAIDDQAALRLDYSGGWRTYKRPVWTHFANACGAYDGPQLAWLVTACKAPDGSYWALQSWQRSLPSFGREPTTAIQNAWELRLSHWAGEIPRLEIWQDWVYAVRLENLIARFTYRGKPVFGYRADRAGAPLDPYGRNVYFDSLNSAYGSGWRRANGLLTHRPTGVVCAAFADAGFKPDQVNVNHGRGERYRATVAGPGVTPDAYWEGAALPHFNPRNKEHVRHDREMNALVDSFGETDPRCTTD